MAKYTGFDEWRSGLLAAIRKLHADKVTAESAAAELQSRVAEFQGRITALQARLDTPSWAEIESGATVSVGAKVRYFLKTYECIETHSKALTRPPTNSAYWREASD